MRDVIRGIMGGLLTAVLFFGPAAPLYAAAGNVGSRGAEGADAIIHLWADQGDDAVDKWTIEVEASGDDFTINAGSTEVLNITTNGVLAFTGGQATLEDGSLASAVSVPTNSTLQLEGIVNQLSAAGGANNATQAVTLASLPSGTTGFFLLPNTGSSNSFSIAQTANWKSPAIAVGPLEMAVVYASASNAFYGGVLVQDLHQ